MGERRAVDRIRKREPGTLCLRRKLDAGVKWAAVDRRREVRAQIMRPDIGQSSAAHSEGVVHARERGRFESYP